MSTKYEATGKVKSISDAETRGTFTFRKFTIEIEDGKYSQFVEFQTTRDNIDKLNSFRVGDEVAVTFNLRGREWADPKGGTKTFNTLDAWKIEAVKGAQARGGAHEPAPATGSEPDEDRIPF